MREPRRHASFRASRSAVARIGRRQGSSNGTAEALQQIVAQTSDQGRLALCFGSNCGQRITVINEPLRDAYAP